VAPNPLTLVPPRAKPTAQVPLGGVLAPRLPGVDLADGKPRVVCFLRHTGCPFAEATLRSARALAGEAGDAEIVAVTHSDPGKTAAWCARVGGAGAVRVVADESRGAYAAWGLGRTALRHFAGARSLRSVARQAAAGVRNTRAHGTRWQSAGTFGVDGAGVVRWRHVPAHAGDLPDLGAALRAARRGSPRTSP
jgi:hypothetical protein